MNGRRKTEYGRHGSRPPGLLGIIRAGRGVSLIELLFVLVIFALVMAALHQSFNAQVRMGIMREYRQAEAEMELGIGTGIIQRDLSTAGYGLAESIDPVLRLSGHRVVAGVAGTDGGPNAADTLILRGTAIGRGTRASQGWTFRDEDPVTHADTYMMWNDAREDLNQNNALVSVNPYTRKLKSIAATGEWLFRFNGPASSVTTLSGAPLSSIAKGDLMYGYYDNDPSNPPATPVQPYYAVRYYLGGATFPATCALGTRSLMRAESRTDPAPSGVIADHILNCVLDFQVALGIDDSNLADIIDDSDDQISFWDNGAVAFTAAANSADAALVVDPNNDQFRNLNKSLKQIRAYVLVQVGNRDPNYFYSNPDPAYADRPNMIRVGDLNLPGGGVGRDVTLTDEQRRYRWRVLSIAATPRNIH